MKCASIGEPISLLLHFNFYLISGNILRHLKTLKGMKQETMVEKLGINQTVYYKWEKVKSLNGVKLKQLL